MVVNFFCNVWVSVCVGFVTCECSGHMCTCIYWVLYCLNCVFALFRLCIFILICFFFCTVVLPPSDNSIAVSSSSSRSI